jgi:glucokinase
VLSDATIAWKGLPVGDRLADASGLTVVVDADVRAAARAEARLGAGRPFGSFLFVTVGTGISSCLVSDKVPYTGARGLTGTFASSPGLIPDEACSVVSGPPLEQFAAGPSLARRLAAVRDEFAGAAPEVLALAESGDVAAAAIVDSAGQALGAAIAQLVNVLDPEAIVLGGGLGLAPGRYRATLEDALRHRVWSAYHRDIPLLSAQLGTDAGVIGAALGAMARLEK